jgi:peptidyl-prolyl cis-trans isomerase D
MLDRIGFRTAEDADAARARLDAGETDFDALATERGLTADELDQGAVAAAELAPEARELVFGAAGPGVVGPVATPLGPSLFRINAVLAGKTTPFEEAKAEIARERALDQARTQIVEETAVIEDLIAGGATLEEIASETMVELGSIDLTDASSGGLADDPAFRTAAAEAREGEETDLVELADGGLVTLRVEAVDPPAPIPLADIRDEVAADWTAARTIEALEAQARGLADELAGGLALADLRERLNIEPRTAAPLTRGQTAPEVPPALVAAVFAAEPDGTVTLPDGDGVILARITAIEPFDPAAGNNAALYDNLRQQFRTQAADDVLSLYTAALRDTAGVTVNQDLIESTLARFP